jgi:hypothetical protein
MLADTTDLHPERIQAALYQAFDIQALYNTDMHQVTFFATITTSTPQAVAAILADTGHDPTTQPAISPASQSASPPAVGAPIYPLAERPICGFRHTIMEHGLSTAAGGGKGLRTVRFWLRAVAGGAGLARFRRQRQAPVPPGRFVNVFTSTSKH